MLALIGLPALAMAQTVSAPETASPQPVVVPAAPAIAPAATATPATSAAVSEPPAVQAAPAAPEPIEAAAMPLDASPVDLLPHDLSPWSMFRNADIVVQGVMAGLAFASLVTWTIALAKGLELAGARRRARSATRCLERAESLDEAKRQIADGWTRRGPVASLVRAAEREMQRSSELSPDGIKERLAIALSRIEARAGRNMARGTGLLATIGSTAPFVGLFGTVWGIMNSFIGISEAKTTNLAIVAPGIAEALLATAIGLVAAIPAVIVYNVFARSIAGYRALLSDASGEVLQHVSRDLDRLDAKQSRGPGVLPMPRAASLHAAE